MLTIISGGQTGADRTALEVARELGLPTGGTAPLGWQTDDGADPALAAFGLSESPFRGYRVRTRTNVRNADATVLFGRTTSPGCQVTIRACRDYAKPYVENPSVDELVQWLVDHHPRVVNVAGNRRRTNPGIVEHVRQVLRPSLVGYVAVLTRPSPVASTPEEESQETAEAIARIDQSTPETWRAAALAAVEHIARTHPRFTTEDVWPVLSTTETLVHDNRALGPIMLAARRAGWIRESGNYQRAERMAHKRPVRIWESLLC